MVLLARAIARRGSEGSDRHVVNASLLDAGFQVISPEAARTWRWRRRAIHHWVHAWSTADSPGGAEGARVDGVIQAPPRGL